jgi:putative IMPACT (imprinted ancient) family translation regulator
MSSTRAYRENAEHCLRMARTTPDESERPFWLSLAQSWLHLAEHSILRHADVEGANHETRRRLV